MTDPDKLDEAVAKALGLSFVSGNRETGDMLLWENEDDHLEGHPNPISQDWNVLMAAVAKLDWDFYLTYKVGLGWEAEIVRPDLANWVSSNESGALALAECIYAVVK